MTNKGSGVGLYGRADNGNGLSGFSLSGGDGVTGSSLTGSGVKGTGPTSGVLGDSASTGVYGRGGENGVQAEGGTFGVFATASDYGIYARGGQHGVFGQSTQAGGAGIDAASSGGGLALRVTGKAQFNRSGVVTVAAGTSSKTVTLTGVTAGSMILATAQQAAAVSVKAAVPAAPSNGSFRIILTGNAPDGGLKVAYFVLN
jgi:hypothetical protein